MSALTHRKTARHLTRAKPGYPLYHFHLLYVLPSDTVTIVILNQAAGRALEREL